MPSLTASVGKGGVNQLQDVRLVQQLLNRFQSPAMPLLKVDGRADPTMFAALDAFQKQKAIKPVEPTVTSTGAVFKALCGGDTTKTTLAWGGKVEASFKLKVLQIADFLQAPADFPMAAMAFESGESFSPAIKNAAGSGAVGLIQFMPSTAKGLGTTTELLAKMTATEQLDYVQKYFLPQKGRLHDLEDVYMTILYPAAIGKETDSALFTSPSTVYKQNKGLDADKDGKVTIREAAAKVRAMFHKGLQPGNLG